MSYLQKIDQCNNMRAERYTPFWVADAQVGWIRDDLLEALKQYPDTLGYSDNTFILNPVLDTVQLRTDAMQQMIDELIGQGVIDRHFGEVYPVTSTHKGQPEFLIDRAVASYFGTRTFGQHLNGYVRQGGRIKMWIAQRAKDRAYEPGKLDQVVAGGFPHGITSEENLRKECYEEAGMSVELADQAIAVGALSCRYETARGVKPETLYCYDLQLPEDFQPVCTDGEVEKFMLLPIEEVAEIVRDSNDFKLNCNLVAIDFLIRHGILTPEDDDYDLLVTGLHR